MPVGQADRTPDGQCSTRCPNVDTCNDLLTIRDRIRDAAIELYALNGPGIVKPALVRSPGIGARAIEVETWRLPTSELGAFAGYIPAPLGLGRVQLADGSSPTGFIAEEIATDGATEVTEHGGWRAYLRSTGVHVDPVAPTA